ncbi:MAG: FecR family protein [Dyadobacter fermentans]
MELLVVLSFPNMRPDRQLLDKYLAGQCTPDEQRAVEQWLQADRLDADLPPAPDETGATDRIWDEIQHLPSSRPVRSIRLMWLAGLAASVLLVVGISWLFTPAKTVSVAERVAPPARKQTIVLHSPAGKRERFTLPDGSRIHLNAGSSLEYAEPFNRTVALRGEGYFEIARDTLHPFRIATARTQVTVLGTVFNLKAYENEPLTELVVKEGKVRFADIRDESRQLILTADQRGALANGKRPEKTSVHAARYFAWRDNRLVFQDQKLSEIVPVLERWYGVKITIQSKELAGLRYIGTFQDQSLQRVMEHISYALDFKYQLNDHQLTIY